MAEKEKQEKQQTLTEAQFAIQKIYVKDISFETPNSPEVFKMEWKPEVDMNLTSETKSIGDNLYDVVLSITVTVKVGDKTAYLVEIQQAGIFLIDKVPEDLIKQMVATACPNILFPFAREVVTDIITRGGFPQLLLSPVNFDALYMQQQQLQQKKQQQEASKPESKTTH